MPRDVGYVVLRDFGFGVTGRYSDFGGRFYLPLGVHWVFYVGADQVLFLWGRCI